MTYLMIYNLERNWDKRAIHKVFLGVCGDSQTHRVATVGFNNGRYSAGGMSWNLCLTKIRWHPMKYVYGDTGISHASLLRLLLKGGLSLPMRIVPGGRRASTYMMALTI